VSIKIFHSFLVFSLLFLNKAFPCRGLILFNLVTLLAQSHGLLVTTSVVYQPPIQAIAYQG